MKKLKFFYLFFALAVLINCQPSEDILDQEESNKNSLKIQTIPFSEIKFLNKNAFEELKKVNSLMNTNLEKGVNTNNNYQIESAKVKYISNNNGYTSFTIPVIQNDKKLIQNLVFSQYKNGKSSITLNEYVLNKESYSVPENFIKNFIIETNVYEIINPNLIASKGGFSEWRVDIGYYETVDKCKGELVTPGERPDCFNSDGSRATKEVFVTIASDCTSGGGGSGNFGGNNFNGPPNNGGTGNNNSGSGSGGGGSDGNNFIPNSDNFSGVISTPNQSITGFTDYELLAVKVNRYLTTLPIYNTLFTNTNNHILQNIVFNGATNFVYENGGLTQENKDKIEFAINNIGQILALNLNNLSNNEKLQFYNDVFNLILKNSENLDRIIQMSNYANLNNLKFTFKNDLDNQNANIFSSINDLKDYLNSLNSNLDTETTLVDDQGNTKTAKVKRNIGLFTYLNVNVNQTLNPYNVNGVYSSISGNTLCLSYNQITPSDLVQTTTVGNITTLVFSSTLNVNALNDNIGTVWTFDLTIKIKINKLTGAITYINVDGLP